MSEPTRPDGSQPATEKEWYGIRAGDVIASKYEIVSLLGSGGFGAVFQARHQTIGKLVAIKILRAELAEDKQQTARFLQEARAANEVTHRNIVEVLDFGVHEGRPYMVLAYQRGEPLSAFLKREGRMSPAKIIRIVAPVLRALAVAHEKGVIHRDIKPENIFLSRDEDDQDPVPKILDFGIAKVVSADNIRLTDTRAAFGTPAYMAPEQALGARDVSPAADQYAIGVLIYEALSGRLPHVGETYNAVIVAKVTTPAPDLATVSTDIDPRLVKVVMRALAREPADRWPTVSQLREALEPFAGIASVPSLVPGLPESLVSGDDQTIRASDSHPIGAVPTANTWNTAARTNAAAVTTQVLPRRRYAIGAVASVAVLGCLAFGLTRSHRDTTVASPAAAATVNLHIEMTPANAEIRLDGVVVGHGAVELTRPRDGTRHILRASADGFTDLDESIASTDDARIVRTMIPSAPAVAAVPPVPPVPAVIAPVMPVEPAVGPSPRRSVTPRTRTNAPSDSRHPQMDRNIRL